MRLFLASIAILFFFGPLITRERPKEIHASENHFKPVTANLASGDVVLRQGKGFISTMFRNISKKQKIYSHAGIIRVSDKDTLVYHVLGEKSGQSLLKTETLTEFCNSTQNNSYAVYRYSFLSGMEARVNRYLDHLISRGITFDEHFDLSTDSAQYCTELVYKMCRQVAGHELPVTLIGEGKYIGLDDLYLESAAILISKQTY